MTIKEQARLKLAKKELMRKIALANGFKVFMASYQGAYRTFFQQRHTAHGVATSMMQDGKTIYLCINNDLTSYYVVTDYILNYGINTKRVNPNFIKELS